MNLIRESISFIRGADPYSSLQIGKHFLIKKWLEEYDVTNYIINDDLTIDVKGNVYLSYKNLSFFPEYIKFIKVRGDFFCDYNHLISLKGGPSSVGGCFSCRNNQLTSLEGSPSSLGGYFSCSGNQLTSLEGSPSSIRGSFYCYNNQLMSLEGDPSSVGGDFYCHRNKKQFSEEEVKKYCKVEGIIYVS